VPGHKSPHGSRDPPGQRSGLLLTSPLASHSFQVTSHKPKATGHNPQVTSHKSQVTSQRPQVTTPKSQVTSHKSQAKGHRSQPPSHKSQAAAHNSPAHKPQAATTPPLPTPSLQAWHGTGRGPRRALPPAEWLVEIKADVLYELNADVVLFALGEARACAGTERVQPAPVLYHHRSLQCLCVPPIPAVQYRSAVYRTVVNRTQCSLACFLVHASCRLLACFYMPAVGCLFCFYMPAVGCSLACTVPASCRGQPAGEPGGRCSPLATPNAAPSACSSTPSGASAWMGRSGR